MIKIDINEYIEYLGKLWQPSSLSFVLKINNPNFVYSKYNLYSIQDIELYFKNNIIFSSNSVYTFNLPKLEYYQNYSKPYNSVIKSYRFYEAYGILPCHIYNCNHIKDKDHLFETARKILTLKAFL
jgi:hypothetical protein